MKGRAAAVHAAAAGRRAWRRRRVIASAFGGLFSLAVMMLVAAPMAALAIRFGPAEIFALVLFGLSTICGLAERSLLRGLIAGVLGMMFMIVGGLNVIALPDVRTWHGCERVRGHRMKVLGPGSGYWLRGDLNLRAKPLILLERQIGSSQRLRGSV
jgi:Tripartite tricarboxylate transporter TctA family